MTPTRLAMTNLARFARTTAGSTVAVAIAIVMVLLSSAFTEASSETIRRDLSQGSGLRQIDLYNDGGGTSVKRLTTHSISEVTAVAGVERVEPVVKASLSTPEAVTPYFAVTAVGVRPSTLPPITATTRAAVFPLRDGEIVLPATHQSQSLAPLLGRTMDVEHVRQTGPSAGEMERSRVTVVALFDTSYQVDGPESAYATLDDTVGWASAAAGRSPEQFLDEFGYFQATVVARSAEEVPAVTKRLQDRGYFASSVQDRIREMPGIITMLQFVSRALLVVLILLSITAGAGVGASIARTRVRQIGILKALGYTSSHVRRSMTTELAVLGLAVGAVASVVGVSLGIALTWAFARSGAMPDLLSVSSPGPLWVPAVTVLLPAVGLVLGGSRRVARAAGTEPMVSLRSW